MSAVSVYLYERAMSRLARLTAYFLLIALSTTPVPAKTEGWIEVQTPHFVVLTNSGEKQGRRIADQFERMRSVFHKIFPRARVDPGSPIVVLALKDKKDFRALEPSAYLAKGQLDLAGLFLRAADKNYVLLRLDAEGEHPYATIYHEYTHLLSSHAEWMPLWINEGLAQFYENTDINGKEVLLGQASIGELYFLQQNRLLPLPTLFAVDHNSPYYHEENKGSMFYAESWALTHYLSVKDYQEKTDRLTKYLESVSKHVDPVTAATQAFGDLKKLQSDLDSYISRGQIGYFKMAGGTDVDDSTFKVQSLTTTQADAIRADFLACNEREKDARQLLEQILHDDPANVAGHETMGFLAFKEGKLDEAEKWYEKAVKLDSQSFLAHYYFATIAMREGQLSGDRQSQIESSLLAATKLNPDFAPAYDQLAAFYGMQHKNLEDAHRLTLMAVQLEPNNVGFRTNAANVLMEMERPKDAIAVLQAALKIATSPEQNASIQRQIESVQRYQLERERMDQQSRQFAEELRSQGQPPTQESDSLVAPNSAVQQDQDNDRHGPKRTVKGTLRHVECGLPAVIKLKVESDGKAVPLRARNYYKIPYSALNFTPSAELNPCKDLEGMKAKVEFYEGLSESADGQIISIELAK